MIGWCGQEALVRAGQSDIYRDIGYLYYSTDIVALLHLLHNSENTLSTGGPEYLA